MVLGQKVDEPEWKAHVEHAAWDPPRDRALGHGHLDHAAVRDIDAVDRLLAGKQQLAAFFRTGLTLLLLCCVLLRPLRLHLEME